MAYRRKSYNYWERKFKLMQNHIEKNAAYGGTMFETYGKDLEHVLSIARDSEQSARVWTLIDGDGNSPTIVSGYCIVNRLGYFITELPFSGPEGFMEVVG